MKWTIQQYYHIFVRESHGPAINAAALSKDRERRPRPAVKRSVASLAVKPVLRHIAALAVTLTVAAAAHGQTMKIHGGGVIDLVPGADRGTITQDLLTGTIASTGQEVWFVITDASDKKFAEMFGAVRADSLEEAPSNAVEDAIYDEGKWTFYTLPGPVAYYDGDGKVVPPAAGNSEYSPLKRIKWKGKTVTVNVPFIKWGDGPGQQLLIDQGGCDPLIRSNPPSPFFVGDGPTNGADCTNKEPLDRYKGGQVLALDETAMTVTLKLHKATFDHPDKIPYYTVFDASKLPPAGFMGVIYAPKTGNLGRFGDNDAVGRIAQFSNGVRDDADGPVPVTVKF